jgi:hypothetical protein
MSGAHPGSTRRRYPVEVALLALGASALASSGGCAKSAAEIVNGHPWQVTVYYTAVESLHNDPPVPVQGCATRHCKNGDQDLGAYPESFVSAVHEEGTGRITSGPNAGMYLNWSDNIGFWLDSATRDAHGRPLQPFSTAAADDLPDGTALRLVDCGQTDSGDPVPVDICQKLSAGSWRILDQFGPGLGGSRHIDLYIGEEDIPDFTESGELYVSLQNARFSTDG